jgi:prepilin signal peptidase PulO-like enzyme (type II secretory pathway)
MRAADKLSTRSVISALWQHCSRRVFEDAFIQAGGCVLAFSILDVRLAALVAAWWCLVILIVRSDIESLLIPDWATAGIALLALLRFLIMPGSFTDPNYALSLMAEAAITPLATFAALWTIGWAYARVAGREGLGFGDVKLAAAFALWLQPYDLILTFELAIFGALLLVVAHHLFNRTNILNVAIPFGAFLAPAAWIVFMSQPIGEAFWSWRGVFQ